MRFMMRREWHERSDCNSKVCVENRDVKSIGDIR